MTTKTPWRWARAVGGAAVLLALLLNLGTRGVIDALQGLDAGVLGSGVTVAAVTTVVGAWRWRVVAGQLGVPLSMPTAVAACYRSQFLNVTLPGGVLGDVDRAVHHGRAIDDVGRGLRAVAWERTFGQVVLVAATVGALALGGPLGRTPPLLVMGACIVFALLGLALLRTSRTVEAELRCLRGSGTLLRIGTASIVVLSGHILTFALAARAVGVRMPVTDFVPLALFVLLAAGIPLNLAGWGPREGAAAWAFAATGATATQGLAVSVAFGVIVLVGTLPGAALLLKPLASADAAALATVGADARRWSPHE